MSLLCENVLIPFCGHAKTENKYCYIFYCRIQLLISICPYLPDGLHVN